MGGRGGERTQARHHQPRSTRWAQPRGPLTPSRGGWAPLGGRGRRLDTISPVLRGRHNQGAPLTPSREGWAPWVGERTPDRPASWPGHLKLWRGRVRSASRVYSYCYVPRMRKSVRFCVCVMYLLGRREPTVATPTPYSLLLLELFIFPSWYARPHGFVYPSWLFLLPIPTPTPSLHPHSYTLSLPLPPLLLCILRRLLFLLLLLHLTTRIPIGMFLVWCVNP